MITENLLDKYHIICNLPFLCIQIEHSLLSVQFLIERLCNVSAPDPRASEPLLPLTCGGKHRLFHPKIKALSTVIHILNT